MTTTKKRKLRGRKPNLTRPLLELFVKRLSVRGNTVRLICQELAVGESTYYSWLEKGAEEDKGIYREFLEATTQARARGQTLLVSNIAKQAAKDWRAAAWLLERMNPKDWGNQPFRATIDGTTTPPAASKPGDELLTGGFSVAINIGTVAPEPPPEPPL